MSQPLPESPRPASASRNSPRPHPRSATGPAGAQEERDVPLLARANLVLRSPEGPLEVGVEAGRDRVGRRAGLGRRGGGALARRREAAFPERSSVRSVVHSRRAARTSSVARSRSRRSRSSCSSVAERREADSSRRAPRDVRPALEEVDPLLAAEQLAAETVPGSGLPADDALQPRRLAGGDARRLPFVQRREDRRARLRPVGVGLLSESPVLASTSSRSSRSPASCAAARLRESGLDLDERGPQGLVDGRVEDPLVARDDSEGPEDEGLQAPERSVRREDRLHEAGGVLEGGTGSGEARTGSTGAPRHRARSGGGVRLGGRERGELRGELAREARRVAASVVRHPPYITARP